MNGPSQDGHLTLPKAKAPDTRSQGIANITSKTASALQTSTTSENVQGNIHRKTSTAKATTSNGTKALASSR